MDENELAFREAAERLLRTSDVVRTQAVRARAAMGPYLEHAEQLQHRIQPYIEAGKRLIEVANSRLAEIDPAVWEFFAELESYREFEAAIEPTGCLPHRSIPRDEFVGFRNSANPRETANEWLADNWQNIEASFFERVDQYQIDENSRELFRDALSLQGKGLHLVVVRAVFPELEKVFRRSFGLPAGKPATSLQEFRNAAVNAPLSAFYNFSPSTKLMRVLDEHLYAKATSEETVEGFKLHPIPNRHAALHGLIDYRQPVHGYNVLVMADFVFHMVGELEPDEDRK